MFRLGYYFFIMVDTYNIYLLKSHIYILNTIQIADTNGPSRSHRLIHVIHNCEGPRTMFGEQYNTNSNIFVLCFDLLFI